MDRYEDRYDEPPDNLPDDEPVAGATSSPVAPADLGSASRSCLAILILGAAIVLLLCVSLAVRALL